MAGEISRIIYLSLIGFAALAYVLYAYRGRMGQALQSALIWALIFVAAITLYGFKDTFNQQVFGGQSQRTDNALQIPVSRDGHYYADILINNVSVEFIVDTGASDIVLSNSDAERIGLNLDNLIFLGRAETANGIVKTASVRLNTIEFGTFVDHDIRAHVTDGETGSSLLGMAYLSRFSRIEIADGMLILHR